MPEDHLPQPARRAWSTKVKAADGTEIEEVIWVNTGIKPEDLLSSFRNSYNPRIAVTVDMIATGTDIKPLEIVFFMRAVRSRTLFEQMKGRGARTVSPTSCTPSPGRQEQRPLRHR